MAKSTRAFHSQLLRLPNEQFVPCSITAVAKATHSISENGGRWSSMLLSNASFPVFFFLLLLLFFFLAFQRSLECAFRFLLTVRVPLAGGGERQWLPCASQIHNRAPSLCLSLFSHSFTCFFSVEKKEERRSKPAASWQPRSSRTPYCRAAHTSACDLVPPTANLRFHETLQMHNKHKTHTHARGGGKKDGGGRERRAVRSVAKERVKPETQSSFTCNA